MSACPDCGRHTVPEPCGHVAFCGRRVQFNDVPDDWRARMLGAIICRGREAGRSGGGGQSGACKPPPLDPPAEPAP